MNDFQIDLGDLQPHTGYRAGDDDLLECPECGGDKDSEADLCDACQDWLDEEEDDES